MRENPEIRHLRRASRYVVPVAAGVLIAVFMIQSRGSGAVGGLFGPVMAVWFVTLAVVGIAHVIVKPGVVVALNPLYALAYIRHASGWTAFNVLGSVFLALTGGEALYADMGHFGRRASRINWFVLVMPALVLNYLGQGALVCAGVEQPGSAGQPDEAVGKSMCRRLIGCWPLPSWRWYLGSAAPIPLPTLMG